MNRLVRLLVVLVVAVAIVGYYRGWFTLSTDSTGQTTSITITADKEKLQEDRESAQKNVEDLGRKLNEQVGAPTPRKEDQPRP